MYRIIGIMTGNSLDAADVVLTEFDGEKIRDLAGVSEPFPRQLRDRMLTLRQYLQGGMSSEDFVKSSTFQKAHEDYIRLVARAVRMVIMQARLHTSDIDAIGFHGQTVDYCGTSMAVTNGSKPYTTQMGSGQMLADMTGIPVIYDFRSDDMMAGGNGAPLAPVHNKHLAASEGIVNAIYYNAGNTSNLALIHGNTVLGWDAGPFNEFPNRISRIHYKMESDIDGLNGLLGHVDAALLQRLYHTSAITPDGQNFMEMLPPKSSDPHWYKFLDELRDPANLEDKMRTAEYFAGYVAALSLKFIPQHIKMPRDIILFGGGWKNPVCRSAFEDLLNGTGMMLPEHIVDFDRIINRFDGKPRIWVSRKAQFMEARTFADLARYYLENKPWMAEISNLDYQPVRLGRMRKPNERKVNDYISRAAKGWQDGPQYQTWLKQQEKQRQQKEAAQTESEQKSDAPAVAEDATQPN